MALDLTARGPARERVLSRKTLVLRGQGGPETLVIEGRADSWRIFRAGRTTQVQALRLADGRLSVLCPDGRQVCGRVLPRRHGGIEISTAHGVRHLALADQLHDRVDHSSIARAAEGANEEIRALMPGRVIEVAVVPGKRVEAGGLLLVLEAMKMQNEIRAERAGVVRDVRVAAGEAIESGSLMMSIDSGGM